MKNWSSSLFIILVIIGLSMDSSLAQTHDMISQIKKQNQIIDSILWLGDAANKDPGPLINDVIDRCENKDCGEELIRAQLYKTVVNVNSGESESIYSFAIPTLSSHTFEDATLEAYFHEIIGLHYFFQGDLDSVRYYFSISKDLLEDKAAKDKRLRATYEYLGFYHSYSSQHDSSLYYMGLAADQHIAAKDTLSYIKTTKYLSTFYGVMGESQRSLDHLVTAKRYAEKFPLAEYLLFSINSGIGNSYLSFGQYDKAIEIYQASLEKLRSQSDFDEGKSAITVWDLMTGIATAHLKAQRYAEGLEVIYQAKELCEKHKLSNLEYVSTYLLESEGQIGMGNYEQALTALNRVFSSAENSGTIDAYNIKAGRLLSDVLLQSKIKLSPDDPILRRANTAMQRIITSNEGEYNKEYAEAVKLKLILNMSVQDQNQEKELFRKYVELSDTLHHQERINATSEALVKLETEAKEQKIKLQELQLEKSSNQKKILGLIGTLLLLLTGFVSWLFYDRHRQAQKLDKEVKKRTAELSQAKKELEQLTYVAFHDLKEPLRSISSFASLSRTTTDEQKADEYMNLISQSAKQMNKLINSIQAFSSLNNIPRSSDPINLNHLIEEVKHDMKDYIQSHNAIVNAHDLPTISSDIKRLKLLFESLIQNAIYFNKSDVPTVDITSTMQSGRCIIIVSDNGIGIDPAFREQVFEMFSRLHPRQEFEGAGIGLSICKKIVEDLDGHISIEINKDQGSSFKIEIPQ